VSPELDPLLAELRREGPRRFAGWDAGLFDAVVTGPAAALADALLGQPDAGPATAGYLRLAQQAVGAGRLRRADGAGGWAGFLERCLVEIVPALLPHAAAADRLPLLVKVWNLGEGLAREPVWLDRYVCACCGGLGDLGDVEAFLVRTLEPVLAPSPPAAWEGPFTVAVLDLRPLHDEFLPGEVRLAAPNVVCVRDRRLAGVEAGVLLRPGRRSELIGLTGGLGEYSEREALPEVTFADGRATVAGHAVDLPALRRCYRHAVARGGFVAAAAVDSQRLWVVESAR
jgi:hypothetical protein